MRLPSLRPRTVVQKLCLYIGAATCTVLAVTAGVSYTTGRRALEEQTNAEAQKQVQAAAQDLDDFVSKVAVFPHSIAARQMALGSGPDPVVVPYLIHLLREAPPEVYGVYIAFEHKGWREPLAMPWVDRKSWPHPAQVQYDFHDPKQDWYNGPKRTGKLYVTEPYYDDGGSNITMVSVTLPVYDDFGGLIGVAGADLALDQLGRMVDQLHLRYELGAGRADSGEYAYLASRSGKLVTHPNEMLVLRQGFDGAGLSTLPDGRLVAGSPRGSARLEMDGVVRRVYWASAPLTGFKVVLNVPEAVILAPVRRLATRAAVMVPVALALMAALVFVVARHSCPFRQRCRIR